MAGGGSRGHRSRSVLPATGGKWQGLCRRSGTSQQGAFPNRGEGCGSARRRPQDGLGAAAWPLLARGQSPGHLGRLSPGRRAGGTCAKAAVWASGPLGGCRGPRPTSHQAPGPRWQEGGGGGPEGLSGTDHEAAPRTGRALSCKPGAFLAHDTDLCHLLPLPSSPDLPCPWHLAQPPAPG